MIFMSASVLIFVLYPILCILGGSVFIDGHFTLQEYTDLFSKNRVLLEHSFFTAACTAVISTVLGVLIAIRISALRGWRRTVLSAVLLMTMVSPPFISSLMYIQLYGRRGWITYRLLHLSVSPYNQWGIIAMQSLHCASLNALFLLGYIEKLDLRVIRASRDLGAGSTETFFNVVLPMLRPAMAVTAVLSFIRSMADFGTPAVIGGKYGTLASEIYVQLIGYSKPAHAAAMNVLLLIPAVAAFILYRVLIRQGERMASTDRSRDYGDSAELQPEGLFGLAVKGVCGFYMLAMLLQYICIFVSGFLKSKKGKYYFSLANFDELFQYNLKSLVLSLKFALFVALFGTLFGLVLAYYIERRSMPGKRLIDFLATLPYLVPGTCMGIGYILAFNKPPLKLTGTAAIIAASMIFRQLPVIMRIGSASLLQIDRKLENAARDLGAGRIAVIRDVILPGLAKAFATGFIYNFTGAMTTAGAVMFLITAKYKIAVYTLFDAINGGEYGVASLLSSAIILITLAVSGTVTFLTGERRMKYDGHTG